jgi:hypothetical protein
LETIISESAPKNKKELQKVELKKVFKMISEEKRRETIRNST